jgi:hypothetical protein
VSVNVPRENAVVDAVLTVMVSRDPEAFEVVSPACLNRALGCRVPTGSLSGAKMHPSLATDQGQELAGSTH